MSIRMGCDRSHELNPETVIRNLLENGACMPHPSWTKESIYKECGRMYNEMEAIRSWIIKYLVTAEELKLDDNRNPYLVREQLRQAQAGSN